MKNNLEKINNINDNLINIIYISYYFNLNNVIKNPLFILTKIFSFFLKKKYIDHCGYIFFENNIPKIFEANVEKGIVINDLKERLSKIDGKCWIQTLGVMNKEKELEFRKEWLGRKYNKIAAGLAGLDGWGGKILNKFFKLEFKKKRTFCSDAVSNFLISQNYDLSKIEKGNSKEITPSDLFYSDLGIKQLIYKK